MPGVPARTTLVKAGRLLTRKCVTLTSRLTPPPKALSLDLRWNSASRAGFVRSSRCRTQPRESGSQHRIGAFCSRLKNIAVKLNYQLGKNFTHISAAFFNNNIFTKLKKYFFSVFGTKDLKFWKQKIFSYVNKRASSFPSRRKFPGKSH